MLTAADLEVNVLEFRGKAFQFERLVELGGASCAVFSRTETESESRFRPRLVRLALLAPLPWIVLDEGNDRLSLAPEGSDAPLTPAAAVTEVGAEPSEFTEGGVAWKRTTSPGGTLVYAPLEMAGRWLSPTAVVTLGLDAAP